MIGFKIGCAFANECGVSLRDWLNIYEFSDNDFASSSQDLDLVLVTGLIVLGLKQGFSFQFLSKNIKILCREGATVSELDSDRIDDSQDIEQARFGTIFSRPSIEFQQRSTKAALKLVRTTSILDNPDLESAIFSGLLSFLNNQKILVDPLTISKLRTGHDVEDVALGLFSNSDSFSNHTRLFGNLSISSQAILKDRNPDSVFSKANLLAEQVNKFIGLHIKENNYRRELLPTQEERARAVDLFLKDTSQLKRLFSGAFDILQTGFEGKVLKGFHDHDQRHLLFAVPTTGIMLLQDSDGYNKIFGSLCGIFHDAGRLVESIFDYTDPRRKQLAKIHPQISAAIASTYLEGFPDLPLSVRNEVIVAIAMHDTGGIHFPLLDAVQSLDRLQLIGPEYLIRVLGYVSALQDKPILKPKDRLEMRYGGSLAESVSFYLHHLYPNLNGNTELESRLAIASGTFLSFAAGSFEKYDSYFESSVWPRSHWNCLPHNLKRAIERSTFKWTNGHSYEWPQINQSNFFTKPSVEYARELVTFPLVSDVDTYQIDGKSLWERLENRIREAESINPEINRGFHYICEVARAHNQEMLEALAQARNGNDPIWRILSEEILVAINRN